MSAGGPSCDSRGRGGHKYRKYRKFFTRLCRSLDDVCVSAGGPSRDSRGRGGHKNRKYGKFFPLLFRLLDNCVCRQVDPAVIAGDGVDMFKEEGFEIIIVDTSGELDDTSCE